MRFPEVRISPKVYIQREDGHFRGVWCQKFYGEDIDNLDKILQGLDFRRYQGIENWDLYRNDNSEFVAVRKDGFPVSGTYQSLADVESDIRIIDETLKEGKLRRALRDPTGLPLASAAAVSIVSMAGIIYAGTQVPQEFASPVYSALLPDLVIPFYAALPLANSTNRILDRNKPQLSGQSESYRFGGSALSDLAGTYERSQVFDRIREGGLGRREFSAGHL